MKNKITAAVFTVMLAVFTVILLCPADFGSLNGENRNLSAVPPLTAQSVSSGEFTRGFESFVDDNIGFRSFFTSLHERLNAKKGIKTPAGRLVYANSDIGTDVTKKSGFLIINNSVFELFIRNKNLEDKYAEAVNSYAGKLSDKISLYLALIPTSLEFQDPIYSNTQDSQKETIDYIYNHADSRFKTVDMYSALQNHSDEYIFFRTDHHWTQKGAYYGYDAFLSASNGGKSVNMDSFPHHEIPNFLGSLYKQASAVELSDATDTIEWYDTSDGVDISMRRYEDNEEIVYKSPVFYEEKTDYSLFLSGDNPLVELTNTNNPTGKTLLIIRDSFANAFAPWIIHNYRRVVLADPRSCGANLNEIVDEFEPDEVLIMNYVLAASFEDYSDILSGLCGATLSNADE